MVNSGEVEKVVEGMFEDNLWQLKGTFEDVEVFSDFTCGFYPRAKYTDGAQDLRTR